MSGGKAKQLPLAIPAEGQGADSLQAPWGQLDWLTSGENGLDDVRREEDKLDRTREVTGIDSFTARDLP